MKGFWRVLSLLFVLFPIAVTSQTVYSPKQAKASLQVVKDKVKVGKNGKAFLQFKITPFEDYVIYSLKEKNGAPISIETPKLNGFVFGLPKESPPPKKHYDDAFEADVYVYDITTTISIPINIERKFITTKQQEIEIVVSFQTISNEKGQAFFEEIPIKFHIIK